MTSKLEEALIIACHLPEDMQDALAEAMLDMALPTIE